MSLYGKDGEVLHLSLDGQNPLNRKGMTEDLKQVADEVTANTIFCTKEVLTRQPDTWAFQRVIYTNSQ
mgnify:CR=1 FL=1